MAKVKLCESILVLTKRELEVAALVSQGLQNAEIAGRLSLTTSTIDSYVSNIISKTGEQNRVGICK